MIRLRTHAALLLFPRQCFWPVTCGRQWWADRAEPSHAYEFFIEKAEPSGRPKSQQNYSQQSFAGKLFVCFAITT